MTFRLRKDAKFQDGTPVTAEDVKWSLDRVVTAPVLGKAQLLTGSMTSADQFKVIDPLTIEVTLPKPDKLALAQSRHRLSDHLQLQGRQGACDGGRSLGTGMAEGEHGRQRRLQDRDLQAGRAGDHGAQRGLESRHGRQVGVLQARHRAVGAGAGDARQPGRARRCRSRRRSAGERRAVARGQGQAEGDLDAAIQFRHLRLDEQPDPAVRQRQCAPRHRLCVAL